MTADSKPKGRRSRKPVKPPVIDLEAEEVKTDTPAGPRRSGAKSAATKPAQARRAASDAPAAKQAPDDSASGPKPDAKPEDPATAGADEATPTKPAEAARDKPRAAAASSSAAGTSQVPEPPPPPGRSSGGIAGYLGAGAVGAIVALGMSYYVGFMQRDMPIAAAPPADLIARLDALEATQGEAAARIDALSETTASGSGASQDAIRTAIAQALEPLEAELDATMAVLGTLESGQQEGDSALREVQAQTEALREQLSAIAASGIEGGSPDALAGIRVRIDALQGEVTALRETPSADIEALARQAAEDAAGVVALEAARQASETALEDVNARLLALDAEIAALKAEFAQTGGSGGADVRVAQALALAALRDALASGREFATEFETLRALLPDYRGLLALEANTGGVATAAMLAERFDVILPDLLAAARQSGEAGVMARLIDNARSIVTVRQVGAVDGDTPEALVARIEASLAAGDLAAAAADWQRLPQSAQAVAADWGAALKARVAAETVVVELGNELIGGMEQAH